MSTTPEALFVVVRDTDPDVLDSDELDVYQRRIAELKAWCESRQVRATRRNAQFAVEGRAGDPRGSLSNHGRQSGKDAAAAAEREQICTSMPGFEDALADGEVSPVTSTRSRRRQETWTTKLAPSSRRPSRRSPRTTPRAKTVDPVRQGLPRSRQVDPGPTQRRVPTSTNSKPSASSRRSHVGSTRRPGCTRP